MKINNFWELSGLILGDTLYFTFGKFESFIIHYMFTENFSYVFTKSMKKLAGKRITSQHVGVVVQTRFIKKRVRAPDVTQKVREGMMLVGCSDSTEL